MRITVSNAIRVLASLMLALMLCSQLATLVHVIYVRHVLCAQQDELTGSGFTTNTDGAGDGQGASECQNAATDPSVSGTRVVLHELTAILEQDNLAGKLGAWLREM